MRYDKEQIKGGRKLISGGPRDSQRRFSEASRVEELQAQIQQMSLFLSQKPSTSNEDIDAAIRESVSSAIKETSEKYELKISSLNEEIERLKQDTKNIDLFTPEQVDEIVNKSVLEYVEESKAKREQDIRDITNKLTSLLNEKTKEYDILNNTYEKSILNSDAIVIRLEDKIKSLEDKLNDKDRIISSLENKNNVEIDSDLIADLISKKLTIDSDGNIGDINRPKMETVVIDPSEQGREDKLQGKIETEVVVSSSKENVLDKANKLKGMLGKLPKLA